MRARNGGQRDLEQELFDLTLEAIDTCFYCYSEHFFSLFLLLILPGDHFVLNIE